MTQRDGSKRDGVDLDLRARGSAATCTVARAG